LNYEHIRNLLNNSKVIAVIGFSDDRTRPSNRVARYLHGNGFIVYGVNPKLVNNTVDEIKCFSGIADIPESAGIINIFRRSEFLFDLVKEILDLNYKPEAIWTQIGVIDSEAGKLAEAKGIFYIENRCIMTEHQKSF